VIRQIYVFPAAGLPAAAGCGGIWAGVACAWSWRRLRLKPLTARLRMEGIEWALRVRVSGWVRLGSPVSQAASSLSSRGIEIIIIILIREKGTRRASDAFSRIGVSGTFYMQIRASLPYRCFVDFLQNSIPHLYLFFVKRIRIFTISIFRDVRIRTLPLSLSIFRIRISDNMDYPLPPLFVDYQN
jgi:hypothetical protein